MSIKEKHGLADGRKITAVYDEKNLQEVVVTDGYSEVLLSLSACPYPVALKPEQARFIAKLLIEAADRLDSSRGGEE